MTDITEGGKYYIPTIEEFHVGFECQYLNKWMGTDRFDDIVISEENYLYQRDGDYDDNNILESKNKFRVKHLDSDDILSLGWQTSDSNEHGQMYTYGKSLTEYCLWLSVVGIVTVFRVTGDKERNGTIFQGSIRNKSELKRLMNQLGITK